MRTGTYRDREGNLVHVRRTATGYVIRHHDGTVTGIRATSDGVVMRKGGAIVSLRSKS